MNEPESYVCIMEIIHEDVCMCVCIYVYINKNAYDVLCDSHIHFTFDSHNCTFKSMIT